MTKKEKEIIEIIETLEEEIKLTQVKGDDRDWVDWDSKFGVLISVNESEKICSLLRELSKKLNQPEIRTKEIEKPVVDTVELRRKLEILKNKQ